MEAVSRIDVNDAKLGWIKEPWEPIAFQTCADDPSVVMKSTDIFGEQPLTGGKYPSVEESPLSAVGVTADDQIQGQGGKIRLVIFGMMAE